MAFGLSLGFMGLGSRGAGGGPLVSFDFTGGSLPAGMTFTRASSGAYVDESGILQTASTNEPRFGYDPVTLEPLGILCEGARTNLFLHSNDYAQGNWVKNAMGTASVGAATGWDGTASLTKYTLPSLNNFHYLGQQNTITAGQTVTISWVVKDDTQRFVGIRLYTAVNNWASAIFDLTLGTVTSEQAGSSGTVDGSGIEDLGGGLYRIYLTAHTATGTNIYGYLTAQSSGTVTLNAGHGGDSYLDSGEAFFAGMAQMEVGASPTSYIPTTSATVTRAADVASYTIPAGVTTLRYTFDDDSTQDVATSPGAWTIPTNLNRSRIKTIMSI